MTTATVGLIGVYLFGLGCAIIAYGIWKYWR